MGRENLGEKEQVFIQKQWECLQQELGIFHESGAFDHLLGLRYQLEDMRQENSFVVVLQTPVASYIEKKLDEDAFVEKNGDLLGEAEIIPINGDGPIVQGNIYYNFVDLIPFRKSEGERKVLGYESLSVSVFSDKSLSIKHAAEQIRESTRVIRTSAHQHLSEPEWRRDEGALIDNLFGMYQEFPAR